MAKFQQKISGDIDQIVQSLNKDILSSAMSMESVDRVDVTINGIRSIIIVYDKYYMRNSSRASLTLNVIGDGTEIWVNAIGAGGGNGSIFNFSWGTEEDIISAVESSLHQMGY